ncbi:MAG: hypothetical protein M1816_004387 [Peltula sp. TS41687]|nr:MAG: hypothetical protein M1816_004387 [Peltula sp. TS41687]
MAVFANFLYSQLLVTLPEPDQDFSGQTIVVTGSNTGLGLEAARHLVRLNAEKVILAVRNIEKGQAARQSIEDSTKRLGVVDVWKLDLSSYNSVKQFAQRAQGLERLDVVVENAGIVAHVFELVEDMESTLTINVMSTFLLALLILPKLRETATRFNTLPRLVVVSSEVSFLTSFNERKSPNILQTLNDQSTANMDDRYPISKLLEVFLVRELARRTDRSGKPDVVINCLNPGFCQSELSRGVSGIRGLIMTVEKAVLARTTEAGSRTLVHAAAGGKETHGSYMSNAKVARPAPLVLSPDGVEAQKRVWAEVMEKLEAIQPGIAENI